MTNMFMTHIYNKKLFGFSAWRKYKKFLKTLKTESPSFAMLWQMADFIKILDRVYMYKNVTSSRLYSSDKFEYGQNGFIVNDEDYKITVKTYTDDEKVIMEVLNKATNKVSKLVFINGQWSNEFDEFDELLLEFAIDTITSDFSNLLQTFYKMRKV